MTHSLQARKTPFSTTNPVGAATVATLERMPGGRGLPGLGRMVEEYARLHPLPEPFCVYVSVGWASSILCYPVLLDVVSDHDDRDGPPAQRGPPHQPMQTAGA